MRTSNNSARVRYAVIQLRQSNGGIERFVIGYEDERAVRQLLVKSSIVATGFLTRDEATKRSVTSGSGKRVPLSHFSCGFRVSTVFDQLRVKMRTLSRIQGRVGGLNAMNNAVHIARCVLEKLQSRFTHGRRQLEPAVQSQ
jgi:hypothetical protein